MLLGTVLFLLFAAIAAVGAYFVTAPHRGRGAGIAAAVATIAFFVALGFGVVALMRGGGAL